MDRFLPGESHGGVVEHLGMGRTWRQIDRITLDLLGDERPSAPAKAWLVSRRTADSSSFGAKPRMVEAISRAARCSRLGDRPRPGSTGRRFERQHQTKPDEFGESSMALATLLAKVANRTVVVPGGISQAVSHRFEAAFDHRGDQIVLVPEMPDRTGRQPTPAAHQ